MPKPIILYDIPSTLEGNAWSPNTWKSRYVLNFKKLPYQTVWVEYPDIKSEMQKIGAEPTSRLPDGNGVYTLPVIQDPNTGTVVSESYRIAEYLEKTYPDSPKLFPTGSDGLQAAFCMSWSDMIWESFPKLLLKMAHDLLNPASREYFRSTREKAFGKPIESLDDDAEGQWAKFRELYSKAATWYGKNGSGPFIHGDQLTCGDIVVAVWFRWYRNMAGGDSEHWKTMLTWNEGRWSKLLDALRPYESVL